MAKSISDEELQLRKRARRRLVGAFALVTITAVFLPMVLDHEPKPVSQDVRIQIPSPNSGAFTSKIVPLAPSQKSAPVVTAKPEAAGGFDAPAQAAVAVKSEAPKAAATLAASPANEAPLPAASDTEAAPPRKAAAAKPQPASSPAEKNKARTKGGTAYIVQVAALNDTDKARQIQEQLAAAGVKVYTEIVPTTNGNVTRVRAGPYASREDAEKARDKLKGMGLSGNVLSK